MKEAVQTLKRQRVRMMLVNLAYFIVLLILGVGVVVALWLVMSAKKRKDD